MTDLVWGLADFISIARSSKTEWLLVLRAEGKRHRLASEFVFLNQNKTDCSKLYK